MAQRNWQIFYSSVFFVLGFSVVFALLGELLQTVLVTVSSTVQLWLSRIGGILIILFGIFLLDLLPFSFLQKEYKPQIKTKIHYLTAFLFGATFAVGWTPCVGPVLGSVLTLAIVEPGSAFFLLLAYSLGLGLPFLLVGLFTNEAQRFIQHAGSWIKYLRYFFAVILIIVGVLVFTNQLVLLANVPFLSNILLAIEAQGPEVGLSLNIGIAFVAGLVSFLSPCVLPLIPSFLSYLAAIGIKK